MNSALIRRLRREAKANPAKAAALAIVVVVAMWFWAPLVIHWCSPAEPASEPNAPVAAESAQPNVVAASRTVPAAATKAPSVPWQQIMQSIHQDPRMQPARQLGVGRDPFGPSAAAVAAQLDAAKANVRKPVKRALPPDLMPADAGLVLNSTLVGSGRRMALIGGEPYWEGDTVPAPRDSVSFRLVEIFPRQVVLERQGKRYGLEIKTTTHDTPLAADLGKPTPASLPHNSPTTRPPQRGAKRAAGKQAPFANVNASSNANE